MSKAKARPRPTERPAANPGDGPIIFVVDDDEAVRESLEYLMDSVGRRVETFASGESFLEWLGPATRGADGVRGCLLLDVRMPGMGGLALQQVLAERGVALPVIILTAHADVPMAVRAMRNGAFDFIEKPCNEQVLLERVSKALAASAEAAEQERRRREAGERIETLSPREREVMVLVVAGHLNKQIAQMLSVSERTVEVHRSRVMAKMGAQSLPDLVRMATVLGIE